MTWTQLLVALPFLGLTLVLAIGLLTQRRR